MGTLFVDKLDPQSGTSLELGSSGDTVSVNASATTNLAGNVTLGANGKTITVPSGCTITNSGTANGFGESNLPFFQAEEASTTGFSDATATKVEFDTESFDSGGCYNNTGSTVTLNGLSVPSYSFCPNVAGTYFFSINLKCYSGAGSLSNVIAYINKNGSSFVNVSHNISAANPYVLQIGGYGFANLNGTGDFVSGSVYMDVGSGSPSLLGGAGSNMFMGYRISAT